MSGYKWDNFKLLTSARPLSESLKREEIFAAPLAPYFAAVKSPPVRKAGMTSDTRVPEIPHNPVTMALAADAVKAFRRI